VGSQDSWACTIVRPPEDLLLFPQDKESFGSITSHEENRAVFSRRRRLPFQSTRYSFALTTNTLIYVMIVGLGIVKQRVENDNPAEKLEYARLQREEMFSVGRVIAMVFDGTSSAQSQSQRPR